MAGMVHVEIPVDDTAGGKRFWGSLFGWDFQAYPEGSEYHMARLTEDSGAAVSGMEGPGKRGLRVYFEIDDMDASVAKVRELGGNVTHGPFDSPHGRIAVVTDPYGAWFSVIQRPT